MEHWLWILLAALFFECKGEDKVMQPPEDVIVTEGNRVTLKCTFETSDSFPYLFWYKQEENSSPDYILTRDRSSGQNSPKFPKGRFHAELKEKSVPLEIKNLELSDSAVYYCALQPTGGYKLYFGSGTKLIIEPRTKSDPSYYKVGNGNDTACLATGFTSHDATKEHPTYGALFNETAPVRPAGSSLYSQVFFPMGDDDKCEVQTVQGVSEDTLESDATVKLAAVITLGLRVIFIKTVVFNVLMTLRLWISQ